MNKANRIDKRPALLNAIAIFSLLVALLLCYYQGFNGPFQLDDRSSVLPSKVESLSTAELLRVVEGDQSGLFGRAIPVISFAINHYLGDGSPYSFKVTNFVLHAITSMVMYGVLNLIFTVLNQQKTAFTRADITKIALFCTAAWALHPLQMSTVLYIVQRMALLSALFSWLALWLFLILRTTQRTRLTQSLLLILMAMSIVAACLSKENGVLAFAYIGFVELVVLRFRKPSGQLMSTYRRGFLLASVLVFITATYLAITLHTQLLAGYVIRDYDVQERLMSEPGVLLLYLKMILLPNLSQMSFYHDAYPVVREWGPAVFIPALSLSLWLVVSMGLYKKLPILFFGVGIFLISHSMESTFLPLELVFEHRNYIALIGVIAPAAWLGMLVVKSLKLRLPLALCTTGVLALLCIQTYTRSIQWSDEEQFLHQALIDQPTSLRVLNAWTVFLYTHGLHDETIAHLQTSHQRRPDSPHFLIQLLMFSSANDGPNEELLDYVKKQIVSHRLKKEEVATLTDLNRFLKAEQFNWPNLPIVTNLFQLASTHSNRSLKRSTESSLFEEYSSLLTESGRLQDALIAAKQSVEFNKTAPRPLLQLATVQLKLEHADNLEETLHQLNSTDKFNIYATQRKNLAEKLSHLTPFTAIDQVSRDL